MSPVDSLLATVVKADNRRALTCAALEANLCWEQLQDAHREFPALWGNPEVLKLLLRVQELLDGNMPDEDEIERKGYEQGEEEGYACALDEFFTPVNDAAQALIACVESEDAETRAEIPEAVDELRKQLGRMEEAKRP